MPTSHYFRQLLANDIKKFDLINRKLIDKKKEIDKIVTRYNSAVNLQGCRENLGLSYI